MDNDDLIGAAASRREFLRAAGMGVMALSLGANEDASGAAPATGARATTPIALRSTRS